MPTSAPPKPPLSRAYTLKASKIPNYFKVLLENPEPEVFDTAFLAKSGFRYAIDRTFIDILKGLGFLSEAGNPTRRYRDFRDHRQAATALRLGLAEAYAGLLAAMPNAAACSERQIMETVSRYFAGELNDMAACGIAATFLALTHYAASFGNGSAIADAAQQPTVTTLPVFEPAQPPSVASGPSPVAASKPVAAPEAVAEPAAGPEPVAEPEPVATVSPRLAATPPAGPEPAARPELVAASGSVAASEPTPASEPEAVPELVAVPEPVAAPEPVVQTEAASPQILPEAVVENGMVAPASTEVAALAAAPLSAVAAVPVPATARATGHEPAAPEATPAMMPEAPPQAVSTPAEAAAVAPTIAPDTTDMTDGAPGFVIEARAPEARSQAQATPQRPIIHIALPVSTDQAVYDAIFTSLKRHLLSPGDQT